MSRFSIKVKRSRILLIASVLLLILLAKVAESVYFGNFEYRQRTKKFNRILADKEAVTESCLNNLKSFLGKGENIDTVSRSNVIKTLESEGITLLWYLDKKLVYWSDNSFDIPSVYDDSIFAKPLSFIDNGWFLIRGQAAGNEKIFLLFRVTHYYGFENDIVKNGFVSFFNLPENTDLTFDKNASPFHVTDTNGDLLFSLLFPAKRVPSGYIVLPVLLWIIALIITLLVISKIIKKIAENRRPNIACMLAFVFFSGIYLILLFMKEPRVFFETAMFSGHRYSLNGFIPSPGHLLILSTLLAILARIFLQYLRIKFTAGRKPVLTYGLLTLCFSAVALLFIICHYIFTSLVANSNINFEPFRVLDLSVYSLTGFISVFFLFLVPLFILQRILSETRAVRRRIVILSLLTSLMVFVTAGFLSDINRWPLVLFYLLLTLSMIFSFSRTIGRFNMTVIFSLYFGLYSVFYVITLSEEKSIENKKVMAVSYSSEHDPEAENLLIDLWKGLSSDTVIKNILTKEPLRQNDVDNIEGYLHEKYFYGYWGNFNLRIVTCGNDMPLQFSNGTLVDNCFDFFRERIQKYGHRITGTGFWFLDNQAGRSYYMGQMFYDLPGGRKNGLFIDLYSDVDAFQSGYSELLLDRKYHGYVKLKDYSFAKYINGNLVLQIGNFPYDKTDAQYIGKSSDYRLFESEGNNHVLYKNGNITVMISEERVSVFDFIISFAYIFAFILLSSNILLLIFIKPDLKTLLYFNLRQKLQLSFISILLFSFVAVGIVIAFFSIRQYQAQHLDNIKEKIGSVYTELENRLSMEQTLSADWRNESYPTLNELLINLSNVFNTDINLFNTSGYLMETSRPEVFYRDLTSRRLNMEAYNNLEKLTKSEYIQKEKIASLEYVSAYVPFYNGSDKLLAYLNLPYFRMQSVMARDISNVIVAVVNFTLLLIVLTMILVVIISGRLTSPLRMLGEGLASVELGKKSEHLSYRGHDEITELVTQYNRMVDELQESAAKLANSEREYAWREMAKQVAHEIKNPLTPMKLNIQQLYKSWKDGIPGFEKKLERFTKSQIENIETLSSIASAFSSFAKMPAANPVDVNIVSQVRTTLELFKNTENITFRGSWPNDMTIMVRADKEHLNGIFSNLIKNAIQSVPQGREGIIRIGIELSGDKVVVSVGDNGTGIPGELRDNLFIPNFTTKSSGMGMGLSIVKRYVENANGRIWFESEHLKGSLFFVELPVIFSVERH
jgi:two-component system, NtrC family, nitrogen regulation sensor histidine kinase NtrY